jgi:hypothetical protein
MIKNVLTSKVVLAIYVIGVFSSSCKKKEPFVDPLQPYDYSISLHPVNTYPFNSKISVDAFYSPAPDFPYVLGPQNVFSVKVPKSDTTTQQSTFGDQKVYFVWKVVSENNDSLRGGKTDEYLTSKSPRVIINF